MSAEAAKAAFEVIKEAMDKSGQAPVSYTHLDVYKRQVLKDLESRGLLLSAPSFEHSYPHCWRCGTPLIYLSLIHI